MCLMVKAEAAIQKSWNFLKFETKFWNFEARTCNEFDFLAVSHSELISLRNFIKVGERHSQVSLSSHIQGSLKASTNLPSAVM